MARTIELTSDEELNQMAEDLGYEPEKGEATANGHDKQEHPIEIDGPGDIMKAMRVVKGIRSEIEQEKNAMEEEINTVKDFREQRIEQKEQSLEYLTQPLRAFIDKWGENYNGPAGHAGYHTVTTTDWKATKQRLIGFAQRHGLRQKITIKAELSEANYLELLDLLDEFGANADVSVKPYKSAIKSFVKESDDMDDSENELYEKAKRQDFRLKPE